MEELNASEVMTEEELRAIDPSEFEGKEYTWVYGHQKQKVIALYDYDIGLSLVDKDDHEDCCVNYCGPERQIEGRWKGEGSYRKKLTVTFKMLGDKIFDTDVAIIMSGEGNVSGGAPSCSFT